MTGTALVSSTVARTPSLSRTRWRARTVHPTRSAAVWANRSALVATWVDRKDLTRSCASGGFPVTLVSDDGRRMVFECCVLVGIETNPYGGDPSVDGTASASTTTTVLPARAAVAAAVNPASPAPITTTP